MRGQLTVVILVDMKLTPFGPYFRFFVGLLLSIFVFSHFVFLNADPDISMATGSRAAWTDDGILLCQVRNFLNGHGFHLLESDGFIKAPLYSAYQGLTLGLFGTHQQVARASVLLLVVVSFVLVVLNRSTRVQTLVLFATTYLLLPIHQHSHLALSEMAAISWVLVSAWSYCNFTSSGSYRWIMASQLSVLIAVGMKIQFLYLLPLPLLNYWFFSNKSGQLLSPTQFIALVAIPVVLCFGYMLAFADEWFLFQKAQSGSIFADDISIEAIRENVQNYLFRKKILFFTLSFLTSFFCFIVIWFDAKSRVSISPLTYFSLVWFVLELHKLPMEYLPIRYMVGFYFSMGLFLSSALVDAIKVGVSRHLSAPAIAFVFLAFIVNLYVLKDVFKNRSYLLDSIQKNMAHKYKKEDILVGPWAPALTWGSSCRAYPVWDGFSNSVLSVSQKYPTAVLTEEQGLDSGIDWNTFLGRGISLDSTSVVFYRLADWQVGVYQTQGPN